MSRTGILAAAVAALALTGAAVAQNYNLAPSFGTYNLRANFAPDPFVVNVTAGGTIPAERIGGEGCLGTIAQAPDVRVNYQAGQFPLYFSVASRADTVLVINLPNGRWLCNDDFRPPAVEPGILLNRPMSGQYDIWVGHYERGRSIPAQLRISEIAPN